MKTVHEVKIPFTYIFHTWKKKHLSNVEPWEPICTIQRYMPPYEIIDIEAGAKGRLEIEKSIEEDNILKIWTVIARVHVSVPV